MQLQLMIDFLKAQDYLSPLKYYSCHTSRLISCTFFNSKCRYSSFFTSKSPSRTEENCCPILCLSNYCIVYFEISGKPSEPIFSHAQNLKFTCSDEGMNANATFDDLIGKSWKESPYSSHNYLHSRTYLSMKDLLQPPIFYWSNKFYFCFMMNAYYGQTLDLPYFCLPKYITLRDT